MLSSKHAPRWVLCGYLIIYGSQILQMHMVMASIAILAAMSVVMYMLIALLEKSVIHDRT